MKFSPEQVIFGSGLLVLVLTAYVGLPISALERIQQGYIRSSSPSTKTKLLVRLDRQPFFFWFLILLLYGGAFFFCNIFIWMFFDIVFH